MSSSILKYREGKGWSLRLRRGQRLEPTLTERAKAGAYAYGEGKGWSLRLRKRAKAGAFAYGGGQRLEPSLTEEGKGWSLRLRKRAKAGAFAYATPSPGSAAKLLLLIRIDLGPQPDELDSHCNDLVCKQPL